MKQCQSPFISVIIPVWNPGPGILRCIDSLRNQTLADIEMIFVDDCGTDDSMDKVRSAAKEDSRIRIIENKQNIGAGPSRNRGINVARGEFLSFVDPDDYVANDFLQLLYTEALRGSFDIVKGSFVRERENGQIADDGRNTNRNICVGLKNHKPLYSLFKNEHQSAIYRKKTVTSNGICYGKYRRGEDTFFLLQICSTAKTFSMIERAEYFFCERWDSALHTANSLMLESCLQSVKEKTEFVLCELAEDAWAQKYLEESFLFSIREGWRYRCNPEMRDSLTEYSKALQTEWLNLPFCEKLSKRSFSLNVLKNQGLLLPIRPHYYKWESTELPVRYVNLVEKWVDYYENNPEQVELWLKDFPIVYINAKNAIEEASTAAGGAEEKQQVKRLLHEQLKRLPLKTKTRLLLPSTKRCISRWIPAPVKKMIKG